MFNTLLKYVVLSLCCLLAVLTLTPARAQVCPANSGFEDGTFNNWKCYASTLDPTGQSAINWGNPIRPIDGPHTIIKNTSPQQLDYYGKFPINSPNGSQYSIRLGDAGVSGGDKPAFCERITYDFIVPDDDFSLTYYIAVVLENPVEHNQYQQPQFITNIYNLDNPNQAYCGSFSFVSSSNLLGFQKSTVVDNVFYKPWTPITIHLTGEKGKRFQLEFITRDCSLGEHFGYAYLDIDENCTSPIKGNTYCTGINSVTLSAPAGFMQYEWYDSNNTLRGTTSELKLSPAPPDGTQFRLHIIPYPGLGCDNTFYTTVNKVNEAFNFQVMPSVTGCSDGGLDLTQPGITAGSTPGLKYDYYLDAAGQFFLSDPKRIVQNGTYYIRGSNAYGCTAVAPIDVTIINSPVVNYNLPAQACYPGTVDLTQVATTNEAGVTINFYNDAAFTIPVANPKSISTSGTYYSKATRLSNGCTTVKAIDVTVSGVPVVPPLQLSSCPPLDLTKAGNPNLGLGYIYYADAQGSPLINPDKITLSGTYYYKGINKTGCESPLTPINVNIYPEPVFLVTDPALAIYPQTVDLTLTHTQLLNVTYTYWQDADATQALSNYKTVALSGTYYVKATNTTGCSITQPVNVQVSPPPEGSLTGPNTFTPNGDGVNDIFSPTTVGMVTINYLKIFNRYGQQIFESRSDTISWDGTINGKPAPTGTYYWVFSGYDIYRKQAVKSSGSVTVVR